MGADKSRDSAQTTSSRWACMSQSVLLDPSILSDKGVENFIQSIVGDELVFGEGFSC